MVISCLSKTVQVSFGVACNCCVRAVEMLIILRSICSNITGNGHANAHFSKQSENVSRARVLWKKIRSLGWVKHTYRKCSLEVVVRAIFVSRTVEMLLILRSTCSNIPGYGHANAQFSKQTEMFQENISEMFIRSSLLLIVEHVNCVLGQHWVMKACEEWAYMETFGMSWLWEAVLRLGLVWSSYRIYSWKWVIVSL